MKNKSINDEVLLPCPFCGGEAALSKFDANANIALAKPLHMYRVTCLDCQVRTATHVLKHSAINNWNQRTKKKRKRIKIKQKQKGGDNAKQTQIGIVFHK